MFVDEVANDEHVPVLKEDDQYAPVDVLIKNDDQYVAEDEVVNDPHISDSPFNSVLTLLTC